ncbi:hypothetical protein GCM10018793_04960 [Streptomyces sulfonofaciens]|uniref:Uncharacterized protein n=1 Tax=Streptomyces sulfonofaciens TaxID=68272 RepID=A0A919FQY4_9ACTN|nr:hypothetical protein [Streptomyces sulfonofaciens]GHH70628.1 hypothetical protein GCM10018793_04960 [Streptomyces sulfonofaciens]
MTYAIPARSDRAQVLPPAIRPRSTASWSLPLTLGILYGLWAAMIDRSAGPITTGNVLFGVFSGLAVALSAFALHQVSPRLPRVRRAFSWGAFTGVTFGWMYSITDAPHIRTVVISILAAAGTVAMTSYFYHVSEVPPERL